MPVAVSLGKGATAPRQIPFPFHFQSLFPLRNPNVNIGNSISFQRKLFSFLFFSFFLIFSLQHCTSECSAQPLSSSDNAHSPIHCCCAAHWFSLFFLCLVSFRPLPSPLLDSFAFAFLTPSAAPSIIIQAPIYRTTLLFTHKATTVHHSFNTSMFARGLRTGFRMGTVAALVVQPP